jgi:hypothetical protein
MTCTRNWKPGWTCTRDTHADGPCALVPTASTVSGLVLQLKEARALFLYYGDHKFNCAGGDGNRCECGFLNELEQQLSIIRTKE